MRFWHCFKRKKPQAIFEDSILVNIQQQTLMPTLIEENEPQYFPVKEIGEKLCLDKQIRNIALTGPYGSGKSSVLYTLQQQYKEHEYLQISLATLESYDFPEDWKKTKTKEDVEQLNRLIEYSILQQLIYREKYATVPNSRIKRIFHFEERSLCRWAAGIVGFFIAYLIAFEPDWLRVEVIYRLFDWGTIVNSIFDMLSVVYMIFGLFVCIRKILSTYCGYQLSKLNLKDGEIELKEASIFNKHLDEIIYFFQRTKYDVVIIEDLDRFNTSDIYLKLRELNQLVNESKEIGRHIVFIYAVKDDVFKDAQRAKFFDYISTVIPVINPSNSKAQLKKELRKRGYTDIADDDLEEMAFFIDDMRLLRNIANEYQQYRTRLSAMGQIELNPTKLLGVVVYKNYFPRDFALLHNRKGDIYKCIASKPHFIADAQKQIEEQKKQLEAKIQNYKQHIHLTNKDLRESCAYRIMSIMSVNPKYILLNGQYQRFSLIIDSEELFEKMISSSVIRYQYSERYYNSLNGELDLNQSRLNLENAYWSRKKVIEELPDEIERETKRIADEERRVRSLRLHELFALYNTEQSETFVGLKLNPMLNVFLRRGYIDEDYYDYISYFYEDSITADDRDLLLAMKQTIPSGYQAKIDKIENFAQKVPLYVFNNDVVLNNHLVDFLMLHSEDNQLHDKYELLLKRIEREDAPLDFIAQYCQNGTHAQKLIERFIGYHSACHWSAIMAHTHKDEFAILVEAWLKFCKPSELLEEQKLWLEANYAFLTNHIESIGLEQAISLSTGRKYEQVNAQSSDLLYFIIANNYYVPNCNNICIIVHYLDKRNDINADNINLTRIAKVSNEYVTSYIKENLSFCINEFSLGANDEDEDALLTILNDATIKPEEKREYLRDQTNRIQSIENIAAEAKDLAMELFLLEPRWENVAAYFTFSEKNTTLHLQHYLENYHFELGRSICDDSIAEKQLLFAALIGSNILNIETYKSIAESFDCIIKSGEYLDDLDTERLEFLINARIIAYTNKNTKSISYHKASVFAKYLAHHKSDYLNDVGNITCTPELALCLLENPVFNNREKLRIIETLDADTIEKDHKLATKICALLAVEQIQLCRTALIATVGNAEHIEDRITVVAQAIGNNPQDFDFIEALLLALPSQYSDIAAHDRKHPTLEQNNYNIWLLDILTNIKYISSCSSTEKGLRVNKRIF